MVKMIKKTKDKKEIKKDVREDLVSIYIMQGWTKEDDKKNIISTKSESTFSTKEGK